MQKVSIENLCPGMIVARNIYNAEGNLLLAAEIKLNNTYISKLFNLDIVAIYIKNPFLRDNDYEIPEIISEATRVQAIYNVKKCFDNFFSDQTSNVKKLEDVAEQILDEIINNKNIIIHLTDVRTYDDYTFAHSVNVCALSLLIAIKLKYNETQLKEIAIGSLLHDIGKTMIPKEILNKPGKLTDEEMDVMKQHCSFGFDILKKRSELTLLSAHIALNHHEKFDGTGYLRGIAKKDIHEYSRIVAIADVYDALTSDRPYRKAMHPHQAYEIMLSLSGTQFDAGILADFLKCVCIFPIGSIVELQTGELAVVTKVHAGIPMRPCLEIIMDKNRNKCTDIIEIDMTKSLTVMIIAVLSEADFLKLC